jgi:hypothetical protein
MLDRRFFEQVGSTTQKGLLFETYRAVYARSTMVLFSRKTKTPLAALTLKADDVGCMSMFTGRPAPRNATETYFQGMLNMPDQKFSFTISNLSNEGMINFNILHTPHRVSQVDPGPSYGINEVNELHCEQSYVILADQRNNRRMCLAGKTKLVRNPQTSQEERVSVTVEESETDDNITGLYFYLSVVPDAACRSLVDKFAEGTTWKVTPGFVRRRKPVVRSIPLSRFEPQSGAIRRCEPASVALFGGRGGESGDFYQGSLGNQNTRDYRSIPMTATRFMVRKQQAGFSSPNLGGETEKAKKYTKSIDVGETQAGELYHGEQVTVSSSYTGHEYAYDQCSEATVLCLSIWEDMKFLPLTNVIEAELQAEIDEWVEHEGKALIESLNAVYRSETCVIDLESEADTIVCTCGHQCLNHANVGDQLRRCPVCRSPITAFVMANGVLLD